MYKVHATQGQGDVVVGKFTTLRYALDYILEHEKEASFGIEYPDGKWHDWNDKETPSSQPS